MGIVVIHLRRPIDDVATSMLNLNWDLTIGWPAIAAFTPEVLDEEHKSIEQYRLFAQTWTDLIDAETVWDLYDVGEQELEWLKKRVE